MNEQFLTKAHSLFTVWENGSFFTEINPDPPSLEEAKPFWVLIRGSGWIPISHLVFARNKEHALDRVLTALKEMTNSSYRDSHGGKSSSHRHAEQILNDLDKKDLISDVSEVDITKLAYKVNWASNGGI